MPTSEPTRRIRRRWILPALLGLVLAAAFGLRQLRTPPTEAESEPGWWRLAANEADPETGPNSRAGEGEALARQLSLPYASGVVRPTGRFGVRAWDRAATSPGVNLYLSGHAAEATLMAMDGEVLHRWSCPYGRAFPGRERAPDTFFFRRAQLLGNGDLVAIYQGGGLVRLDSRSRIVWTRDALPFNDLWVTPDGERILFIEKTAAERPEIRPHEPILEDWIVSLDGSGRELARASILDAFARSPFRDLLQPPGPSADILHTNTVTAISSELARPGGAFEEGNLIVSLREVDVVAVLSRDAKKVLWARRGPFHRQHEPSLLPDGRILLFDNLGGASGRQGSSRILALDPVSPAFELLWPPPGVPFFSRQMGSAARLANGNLLIVESDRGVALEIDPENRVVWEFASPHRAGARRELVAVLADLVRLPVTTPFLERAVAGAPPAAGDPPQAP